MGALQPLLKLTVRVMPSNLTAGLAVLRRRILNVSSAGVGSLNCEWLLLKACDAIERSCLFVACLNEAQLFSHFFLFLNGILSMGVHRRSPTRCGTLPEFHLFTSTLHTLNLFIFFLRAERLQRKAQRHSSLDRESIAS